MEVKVILGDTNWSELIKNQGLDNTLIIQPYTTKLNNERELADRIGRIRAMPIHLPYLKQIYKEVIIESLAKDQLNEYTR